MTADEHPPLRFYLAAAYARRAEILGYAEMLVDRGHEVTSRWLEADHGDEFTDIQLRTIEHALDTSDDSSGALELMEKCATIDVVDIVAADTVVCFTEAHDLVGRRGGRHVEYGIAFGLNLAAHQLGPTVRQRRVVVVGPVENVFYAPAGLDRYPDFAAFLAALDEHDAKGTCGYTTLDPKTKLMRGPCGLHSWHVGAHDDGRGGGPSPNRQARRAQ